MSCLIEGRYTKLVGNANEPRVWAEIDLATAPTEVGAGTSVSNVSSATFCALTSRRIVYGESANLIARDFVNGEWVQVGNSFSVSTTPSALAAMTETTFIVWLPTTDELAVHQFDGVNFSQVGNRLNIGAGVEGALGALSATRIAFIANNNPINDNEELLAFDWDGTNLTQVGASLNIGPIGTPALSVLSSSRVAITAVSSPPLPVQAFDFDGSAWSAVGAAFPITGGPFVQLATKSLINQTVALITTPSVAGDSDLQLLRFDGSAWSQYAPPITFTAGSSVGADSLTADTIVFLDNSVETIRTFSYGISLFGDFEVSFCSQRKDDPDEGAGSARPLSDGTVSNQILFQGSEHPTAPNGVTLVIDGIFGTEFGNRPVLSEIEINQFFNFKVTRGAAGYTILLDDTVADTDTLGSTGGHPFQIPRVGFGNSTTNPDFFLFDLQITDSLTGRTWTYTNRDEPTGVNILTDSGPQAQHGVWVENGTIISDSEIENYRFDLTTGPDEIGNQFFQLYKLLLPRKSRAWRLPAGSNIAKFFRGLSDFPNDIKIFFDQIYEDLLPQTTRQLPEWEAQFGLPSANLPEQQRRDRLAGAWSATGGQSPFYIQTTLQNAGFNVFVHEWWEPIDGRSGGSVSGESLALITGDGDTLVTGDGDTLVASLIYEPAVRNPFDVLASGAIVYVMNDGGADAQDGDEQAMDGATSGATGQVLVNLPEFTTPVIPVDENKWRFFLYIGGEVFPDHANVPAARRREFETLCLKICPTEQWLGLLIDYV